MVYTHSIGDWRVLDTSDLTTELFRSKSLLYRAYTWENQVFVVFTTNESIMPQMLVFNSLVLDVRLSVYGARLIDLTS